MAERAESRDLEIPSVDGEEVVGVGAPVCVAVVGEGAGGAGVSSRAELAGSSAVPEGHVAIAALCTKRSEAEHSHVVGGDGAIPPRLYEGTRIRPHGLGPRRVKLTRWERAQLREVQVQLRDAQCGQFAEFCAEVLKLPVCWIGKHGRAVSGFAWCRQRAEDQQGRLGAVAEGSEIWRAVLSEVWSARVFSKEAERVRTGRVPVSRSGPGQWRLELGFAGVERSDEGREVELPTGSVGSWASLEKQCGNRSGPPEGRRPGDGRQSKGDGPSDKKRKAPRRFSPGGARAADRAAAAALSRRAEQFALSPSAEGAVVAESSPSAGVQWSFSSWRYDREEEQVREAIRRSLISEGETEPWAQVAMLVSSRGEPSIDAVPHVEKQCRDHCAVHAANHACGLPVFTVGEFFAAAEALSDGELGVVGDHASDTAFAIIIFPVSKYWRRPEKENFK